MGVERCTKGWIITRTYKKLVLRYSCVYGRSATTMATTGLLLIDARRASALQTPAADRLQTVLPLRGAPVRAGARVPGDGAAAGADFSGVRAQRVN